MDYTQARQGRMFILKFDHGEDILAALEAFIKKEKIKTAVIQFMGAVQTAALVTGPKKPAIPPAPQWERLSGGWEAVGMGTVFSDKTGPRVHLHGAFGRKQSVRMGCLRGSGKVFLIMEAVVTELTRSRAVRRMDPQSGLTLLHIPKRKRRRAE